MKELLETHYFNGKKFLPVLVSERLWETYGKSFSGMTFPVSKKAVDLTFESTLRKLTQMLSDNAHFAAMPDNSLSDLVLLSEFNTKIAQLISLLINQARSAKFINEFGEMK